MSKFVLKEDKPPIRLPVVFSPSINKEIELIDEFGLIEPPILDEKSSHVCKTESQLRSIIRESLIRTLYS